jgi:hypothetical protein
VRDSLFRAGLFSGNTLTNRCSTVFKKTDRIGDRRSGRRTKRSRRDD